MLTNSRIYLLIPIIMLYERKCFMVRYLINVKLIVLNSGFK